MIRRALLIAALAGGMYLACPASSQAATLVVDDDKAQCPAAVFTTIQSAIDNAGDGDIVEVCDGTYDEQLTIGADKKDLTLRSKTPQKAIIRAPEALANFDAVPLILVTGADNVTIQGFWITGPMSVSICAPSVIAAVLVENGGSATIQQNYIAEIRPADQEVNWCYPSYGVLIRPGRGGVDTSVTVVDNLIEHYLSDGVLVQGAAASARIMRNQILGYGPTRIGRQFGIEIRDGATAEIINNDIGRNEYSGPEEVYSAGIRLDQSAGNVRVERNRVSWNDIGIALSSVASPTVRSNQALSNANYGIAALADVRLGVFEGNQARESGNIDCIDFTMGSGTAGTANTWRGNDSFTAIPAGICGVQ
jgi:parallel beta-helix repeat protein